MAEDAVKVAPDVYKVLFENEKVRVLEVEMEQGRRDGDALASRGLSSTRSPAAK